MGAFCFMEIFWLRRRVGTLAALRFFHSLIGGKQNDLNEENDSSCTLDSLWDLLLYTDLYRISQQRSDDTLFVCSVYFIFGLNIKRRVCVISPKLDEIVDFILHNLHSGATLNEIIGAYDNTPRKEVITIVDKHEYRKLMDFVRKTDPKAFVTVYSVNEMRYQPKIKK